MKKQIIRQLKEDMERLGNVELMVKETLKDEDLEMLEIDYSLLKERSKRALESLEDLIEELKKEEEAKEKEPSIMDVRRTIKEYAISQEELDATNYNQDYVIYENIGIVEMANNIVEDADAEYEDIFKSAIAEIKSGGGRMVKDGNKYTYYFDL